MVRSMAAISAAGEPVSAARREPEHTANAETHGAPTLDEARRRRVFEVLAQLGGNKLQAARILGIPLP